ncbi:MAG: hypothetical protein QF440_06255 [Candidatus Thalassarchaeaceae archaeon]|jgi:hypothetical protein|nr:hypothetical protein [Candidatus Thalassarchaeaceae archaeon]
MAKRLTKALREKRRWVGLHVSGKIESRNELEKRLSQIAPVNEWKLYDFSKSKAILRIHLKNQNEWREILSDTNSEIYSVTISGKIRLVRERLEI